MNEGQFHNFYCSIERHMAGWGLGTAACLIYPWARRISNKSHKFMVDPLSASLELGLSQRSCERAYKELRDCGLFILLESGKAAFESSVHEVLSHKEWALRNPGQCTEKMTIPSCDDPLGPRLYAASDARVKFQGFQISHYRNLAISGGLTDDQVLTLFEDWFFTHKANQTGKQWRRSVGCQFLKYLSAYVARAKRDSALARRLDRQKPHVASAMESVPSSVGSPSNTL